MPVDTQQIMDEADKLGKLVAQHPAVNRYKDAQRSVSQDAEAGRLLAEFDRQLETLARQEQSGMAVTDAQRQQLEGLQSRIISNLKIKNLNIAQVEFVDLLRKINQAIQRQLSDQAPAQGGAAPSGAGTAGVAGAAGRPARAASGPAAAGPGGMRIVQ